MLSLSLAGQKVVEAYLIFHTTQTPHENTQKSPKLYKPSLLCFIGLPEKIRERKK
jgi:hypothetical protein